jgi:hypothetical protein
MLRRPTIETASFPLPAPPQQDSRFDISRRGLPANLTTSTPIRRSGQPSEIRAMRSEAGAIQRVADNK